LRARLAAITTAIRLLEAVVDGNAPNREEPAC
jgi:hypothetical protein